MENTALTRPPLVLALAVVVGLAWGAATSGLQTVLPWPFAALANAVGPWVAPAFVVGAVTRRWQSAVLAGPLVCAGEVAGYYAVSALRGFGVSGSNVAVWAAWGLVGGPVLGVAGWWWRRGTREHLAALGAALLGGVFLAESAVTYGYFLRYWGDAVVFGVLGAVLLVALGATAPGARSLRRTGAWSLLVLPAGVGGEFLLHHLLG